MDRCATYQTYWIYSLHVNVNQPQRCRLIPNKLTIKKHIKIIRNLIEVISEYIHILQIVKARIFQKMDSWFMSSN